MLAGKRESVLVLGPLNSFVNEAEFFSFFVPEYYLAKLEHARFNKRLERCTNLMDEQSGKSGGLNLTGKLKTDEICVPDVTYDIVIVHVYDVQYVTDAKEHWNGSCENTST